LILAHPRFKQWLDANAPFGPNNRSATEIYGIFRRHVENIPISVDPSIGSVAVSDGHRIILQVWANLTMYVVAHETGHCLDFDHYSGLTYGLDDAMRRFDDQQFWNYTPIDPNLMPIPDNSGPFTLPPSLPENMPILTTADGVSFLGNSSVSGLATIGVGVFDYLVVGGGGGGCDVPSDWSYQNGGGGGGGGRVAAGAFASDRAAFSVTVGNGGAPNGGSGGSSSLSDVAAASGGSGGSAKTGGNTSGPAGAFHGGTGVTPGGGGGGAGANQHGANQSGGNGGTGGNGCYWANAGKYYGGGGGGGSDIIGRSASGGDGGGGAGGWDAGNPANRSGGADGGIYLGGGGGGGAKGANGGRGGSGAVIVYYYGESRAADGGYRIVYAADPIRQRREFTTDNDGTNVLNGLTLAAHQIAVFSGYLDGGGSITKTGAGTLVFDGDNTYTGSTTVTAGTLLVNGAQAGAGAISVAAAATFGGGGTIAGPVSISGTLLADDSPTGSLTIRNNLTLGDGARLNFHLGAASGSVVVEGDLVLAGILNIADSGGFAVGDYTLFTCFGTLTDHGLAIGATPNPLFRYQLDTSVSNAVRLLVRPTLASWQIQYFGSTNAPETAMSRDPDGDRLPNIMERALGLNPTIPDVRNPVQFDHDVTDGYTYLRLGVARDPYVSDVLIEGLSASNLTDWSTATTVIVSNMPGFFSVRDGQPLETSRRRFLRLRFSIATGAGQNPAW
jgi:autotransporter-associated beta strand protein